MERLLVYLENCDRIDWLIGEDRHKFTQLAKSLYLELTQLLQQGTAPKILLVESDRIRFLAGFIAACAAGCPVFLGNPNWGKQEWQQVFELVQPDLIFGYGNWGIREIILPTNTIYRVSTGSLIMIPTGGSTGKIKFAIHTWETLTASVQGFQQYFQLQHVNSFCVLPLYHVSGLMQFMRSFTTQGKLLNFNYKTLEAGEIPDIDPAEFFLSLVPTQLQRLLQNPVLADWLAQFKTVLLGGAPAWLELLEQARNCKIRLAPTYGMTETASQIATLKPEAFLQGYNNCGQVLPHAQVKIVNSEHQQLDINQIGSVTIQAKSLALGYYPELFKNQDDFQLDDLGFVDEQGYLNIVGRSSNKIITGGENVYPNEVEVTIRETQLVDDICVIGISDRTWGEVVTAVYVPKLHSVSPEQIQNAIADKLSKFKQPKYWIPLESLPRNLQGKINYNKLIHIAQESLQNSHT